MSQTQLVNLENLVAKNHTYRKFREVFDFSCFRKILERLQHKDKFNGYGSERLFKCILLQHIEDLSDRELERFLQENTAAKWFCEFELLDRTPDYSVFSKFRKRLGIELLEEMFNVLREQLKARGLMNEFFSVVDATHLVSKASLWEERDKAIKEKYEKLNNETLPKVANDKDARIGCKGKNKFWFGYKISRSIDMQSGLINQTIVTPANVSDVEALKEVLPSQGVIYADKGYCSKLADKEVSEQGCILRAIKKNNMKDKNKQLDKFITRIRAPYERMFSRMNKRARYIGQVKNQFSELLDVMSFNLKRLVVLSAS